MSMKGRIVIIDGEVEAASLEVVLRRDGYEVARATTAAAGLERVQQLAAAVVLIDQRVPDMGEIELLAAVKRARPEAAVVMMSAGVSLRRAVQMIKLGAEDYLAKPLDIDEVRVVVRRAVERPQPATIHRFEAPAAAAAAPRTRVPGSTLRELEREAILRTLDAVAGSTSKAAAMLGISARKIQYKMKEYRDEQPAPVAALARAR
jgi:DNA-binding NtrC family response regulator